MSKPFVEALIVLSVVVAICVPIVLFPPCTYAHRVGNTTKGGIHGYLFVGTALHAQDVDRQIREPGFDFMKHFMKKPQEPYEGVSIGWVQVLFQVAVVVACGLVVFIVHRSAEQESESRAFRAALVSTIICSFVLASIVMLGLPIAISCEVSTPTHNPFLGLGSRSSQNSLFLMVFTIGNAVAGVCGLLLGACTGSLSARLCRSRIKCGRHVSDE